MDSAATPFRTASDMLVYLAQWLIDHAPIDALADPSFNDPTCSPISFDESEEPVEATLKALPWPLDEPDNAMVRRVISALQQLDRWHAAICSRLDHVMTAAHFEAAERLDLTDRFNTDLRAGWLIPAPPLGRGVLFEDHDDNGEGKLLDLLQVTTYIPPSILAGGARQTDPAKGRSMPDHYNVRYVRHSSVGRSGYIPPDEPAVMLAPLACDIDDVVAWYCPDARDRYALYPGYDRERLFRALEQSIDAEVTILCTPEMTVAEDWLAEMQLRLRELRKAYVARMDRPPSLRYIMLGCVAAQSQGFVPHANFLAILDAAGDVVVRQPKLSHWDLGPSQIGRFGLEQRRTQDEQQKSPLSPRLIEDIDFGTDISVVDLDDIGRLSALVCADIEMNRPGDWLLRNMRLDFLYAPIMDGSTCRTQTHTPWIIDRSARAARAGCRVLVANSMTMTRWNQAELDRLAASGTRHMFRNYTTAGIGYLVDGRSGDLNEQIVTVALSEFAPQVRVVKWAAPKSNKIG